jgi:hypothetical protein
MDNKEVMDKRDLVDELATTRNNNYTGRSKYECDPLNFKLHWLHWRDMLLLLTFESKNWYQRSDIDEVMDQRSFDDGISQYSMPMQIWIASSSSYIPSTSSDLNYIMSYIYTQQPTWLSRYWRSYGSANFGSETHHRSIDFLQAITTTISNIWR